jgi:hypothetical protein
MVDISPEANIFGIFRNLNYKPWYAIAEFVDNSIASWETWDKKIQGYPKPKSIRVEIDLNTSAVEPYLEIRDTGSGIAYSDFERAFKVASIPADQTSMNEFGMGMKTAGFWFSNRWTVKTSHIGDEVARTMVFDLAEILDNQINDIEPIESRSVENLHFTTVRLSKLNQVPKGRSIGRIKDHLTGMYREFLRSGNLELIFNGEHLAYEEPKILVAKRAGRGGGDEDMIWRKDGIEIDLGNGKKITGFAAIRETGSTTYAGFSLFRKKRLIEGSLDETFRPVEIFGNSNSFKFQRIFGEFHLAGFKVTHTKDAIKWDEGDLELFIDILASRLTDEPLNILDQADKYRAKEAKISKQSLSEQLGNLREAMSSQLAGALEVLEPEEKDLEPAIPTRLPDSIIEVESTEVRIQTGLHGEWQVRVTAEKDPAKTNFIQVSSHKEVSDVSGNVVNDVEVRINLDHPFALQYIGANLEGVDVLFSLTAYLAVALALGKSVGAKSSYIIDYLNEVLKGA